MRADGRIDLDRIAGSGAAPGDSPVYDGARWVPGAPGAPIGYRGGSLKTAFGGSTSGRVGRTHLPVESVMFDFGVTEIYGGAIMMPGGSYVDLVAESDGGTFSSAFLTITKLADDQGAIVSSVQAFRSQSGGGLTSISFPAFTATAVYDAHGTTGFTVADAGVYLLTAKIVWES